VFVGVGVYFIFLDKKLKAKKQVNGIEEYEGNNQENSYEKSSLPEKIKCPYCGCKYNPSLNSCPSCGSGNVKE